MPQCSPSSSFASTLYLLAPPCSPFQVLAWLVVVIFQFFNIYPDTKQYMCVCIIRKRRHPKTSARLSAAASLTRAEYQVFAYWLPDHQLLKSDSSRKMTGRNGKARRTKPRHTELQRSENETDIRAADVSPPTIRPLRLDPSCR